MFRKDKTGSVVYQGSLPKGTDLLNGLTLLLEKENITCGIISGIGAVTQARIAFFNHERKKYEELFVREGMEIISLKGNISQKDGFIFPHVHAVLSGRDFKAIGGHLLGDTLVYAFEFEIIPFQGEPFIRQFDDDTGLYLWME